MRPSARGDEHQAIASRQGLLPLPFLCRRRSRLLLPFSYAYNASALMMINIFIFAFSRLSAFDGGFRTGRAQLLL